MKKRDLKLFIKEQESELARWREHSRVRIKQMEDLKADNDKLSLQVAHLLAKWDKTEAVRQTSPRKREMDALHARNGQLQKNYEDSQEVITRLTRDLEVANAKLELYKAENKRLFVQVEAWRENVNQLGVTTAEQKKVMGSQAEQIASLKGVVEEYQKALDKAKADQAQLEAELANLRERPTLPASPDQTS